MSSAPYKEDLASKSYSGYVGGTAKQWVLSEAVRILRELKLDVFADNVELLSNLIEAAVYDNFKRNDWPMLVSSPLLPVTDPQ